MRKLAGNVLVLSLSLTASLLPFTIPTALAATQAFEADPATLGPIPDGQSTCSLTRDVAFDVSGLAGSITDVSVGFTLDPAHTWVQDLVVELRSPAGTISHTIFGQPYFGADVAGPYLFSDSAPVSPTWWEWAASVDPNTAIPAGSYRTSVPAGQPGEGLNTLMTPAFAGLASASGTWTLRFCDRASQDTGAVSAATLYLSADDVDQPPVAVDDQATVTQASAATAIGVLANDTDTDGGPKTIEAVTQPSNGAVLITDSGAGLTYQPDAGYCNDGDPTDDFTYTLNGGSTATVAVTVTCGVVFEAQPTTLGPIPDGCQDGRDVKFSVSGLAGTITDVAVGFTLDPAHTYVGDLDVQLSPPDGVSWHPIFSGTAPGDGEASDAGGPYTFSDSAPDSPTWWQAAAAAGEAAAIPAGDYRASVPRGQPGQGMNTSITPSFVGTPDPNGQWTLGFCDTELGDTGTVSAATLYLTTDINDQPPVAVDDEATVDEEAAATPVDVLSNDSNADGGPMVISSTTQPDNGVVIVDGSRTSLTYQPDAAYCNDGDTTDDFTYTLNGASTATVSMTVVCIDQPPIASDDFADGFDQPAAVQNGGPIQIDVLANDNDPDGGPMFIENVTQPSNGTVVVPSGGQHLTYEPNLDYCNDQGMPADDFTYTLNGGSTASVMVIVHCGPSERDTDGDGVSDADDLCPETPDGAAVDSNGCAASQRDGDNDGVSDADDACPATPAASVGAVNATGCSPADLQPDGEIKDGPGAYRGGDIYNTTGDGQTWAVGKPPKQTAVFTIKVSNDGTTAESFDVVGCRTSPKKFKVTYMDGTTNVTKSIVAGKYSTGDLVPGGLKLIKLRIRLGAEAKGLKSCLVTAASHDLPTVKDAVLAKVKARV